MYLGKSPPPRWRLGTKRQDKATRLAEALGSDSAKAQNLLMLPALGARSQSSYSLAYMEWSGEGGSCPTSLLQHPMGPAVIILGVLAYLTTPLLVTPSSSLVLLAWGESSLGEAPGSMPRVLPGKQLTGTV